jgi:hypothetical protein
MKIRPGVAEVIYEDGRTGGRTDGQTYMMKPTTAFRNFANAPKIRGSPLQKLPVTP